MIPPIGKSFNAETFRWEFHQLPRRAIIIELRDKTRIEIGPHTPHTKPRRKFLEIDQRNQIDVEL